MKHICLNMNLYDNYSDFFVLSKLVDACRTPRERAIRLEIVMRMSLSPMSLVKSGCLSSPHTRYTFEK